MVYVEDATESGYWWIQVTKTGTQYTAAVKGSASMDWTPIGDGITYDGPLNASGWGLLANVNVNYSDKRRTSTTPTETAAPFAPLPFDYQENFFKVNARLGFTAPNERFAVELWGVNLSNEITRGITANTPLRGGAGFRSRIAFLDEPRTYGVTVRTKF